MEEIIRLVAHSPLYALGAFLLVAASTASFIRKMVRTGLLILIFTAGYAFHMYEEGKDLGSIADRVAEKGRAVGEGLEKGGEVIERAGEAVKQAREAVRR